MYFITQPLVQLARQYFQNMPTEGRQAGDRFFETFCPGNTLFFADKPFERFSDYEELLTTLQKDDPTKYKQIHKGVPFYFLSWTAFDMRNYEKALFYMDAAISEDIRADPIGWLSGPAGGFLTLSQPQIQVAQRVFPVLKGALEEQVTRFNSISGLKPLSLSDFIEKFVKILVQDLSRRTVVTTFYTFLLESKDRLAELSLRSTAGGSIEPFLTHLFKGGLIFESLLKHLYPAKDNGNPTKTLGDVFTGSSAFRADFLQIVETSATDLQEILGSATGTDLQCAFNTTSKLRNTTGHNLAWADIFDDSNYRMLFEQQINAILYLVSRKFL